MLSSNHPNKLRLLFEAPAGGKLLRSDLGPLSFATSLGEDVGSANAKLSSHAFFRSSLETIKSVGNPYVDKSDFVQQINHLCLRQSAGYSAGPQVNVAPSILVEIRFYCDIGKQKTTTRTKNPHNLRICLALVRH